MPMPFGSGSLTSIPEGSLDQQVLVPFVSWRPSSGVSFFVSGHVVGVPSVSPSESSCHASSRFISCRRLAVSVRSIAQSFSSVGRSLFGSIGRGPAAGYIGILVGLCCRWTASRMRVGGSKVLPGPPSPRRVLPLLAGLMMGKVGSGEAIYRRVLLFPS